FLQIVFTHYALLRGIQLVLAPGHLHAHDLGGAEQAIGVVQQAEDAAAVLARVVGANTLEHAHAVMQSMGEHMDLGLAPVHHLTIHPDNTIAICKRHLRLHLASCTTGYELRPSQGDGPWKGLKLAQEGATKSASQCRWTMARSARN